jgi:ribosome-associated heat shock protein Hsp15
MKNAPSTSAGSGKIRLDKWLWAARFHKTRSLSCEEIDKGRVRLNGQPVKPSHDVKPGDTLEIRSGPIVRTVLVRALSGVRGPAPVAALLYEETAESVALRLAAAEQRRLAPEPAHSLTQGRPTKRDRRHIEGLRDEGKAPGWNERWSASMDDD